MAQKFFTNTLVSDYIKNALANTPLPVIDTVSNGDIIIKNCNYIYKNKVIRCTESGYLGGKNTPIKEQFTSTPATLSHPPVFSIESVKVNNTSVPLDNSAGTQVAIGKYKFIDGSIVINPQVQHSNVEIIYTSDLYTMYAKYKELSDFNFGQYYPKLTEKFISKYNYYDSDTHYYLGQYLKCLRDIYDLDLMPFYNCFSYKTVNDFHLTASGIDKTNNNSKKLFAIPIRFNKKYTIAIDSNSQILLKSVFYDYYGLTYSNNDMDISKQTYNINDEIVLNYSSSSFNMPIVYSIENEDNEYYQRMEKYLYLIIQVDASNNSSLVVLEGDYTNTINKNVKGNSFITTTSGDLTLEQQNDVLLSQLTLLKMNDHNIYAFSDRLVEYLLHNVITNRDELALDIARTQYVVDKDTVNKGIWTNELRQKVYEKVMNNKKNELYDINGYVDKTSEKILDENVDFMSDDFINWVGKLRS